MSEPTKCPACGGDLIRAKNVIAFDCAVYDCLKCDKRFEQAGSIWDDILEAVFRRVPPLKEVAKR